MYVVHTNSYESIIRRVVNWKILINFHGIFNYFNKTNKKMHIIYIIYN